MAASHTHNKTMFMRALNAKTIQCESCCSPTYYFSAFLLCYYISDDPKTNSGRKYSSRFDIQPNIPITSEFSTI